MFARSGPDTAMFRDGLVRGRRPRLQTAIQAAVGARADELDDAAELHLTLDVHPEAIQAITPDVERQARQWAEAAIRGLCGRAGPRLVLAVRASVEEEEDAVVRTAVVMRQGEAPGEERTVLVPSRRVDGEVEEVFLPSEYVLQFSVGGAFGLPCTSVHALRHPEVAIGRRHEGVSDIPTVPLPGDRSISRHHLTLRQRRGGPFAEFELEVVGRHGVRAGGRALPRGARVRVRPGEVIELGGRSRGRTPTLVVRPAEAEGESS